MSSKILSKKPKKKIQTSLLEKAKGIVEKDPSLCFTYFHPPTIKVQIHFTDLRI